MSMEYHIRQYGLQQGALEIEYIEEYFGEYRRRKRAAEVVERLSDRDHQIVMAEAALPDDPSAVVPVAYKVSHELRARETDPKLSDLVSRLDGRASSCATARCCTAGLAAPAAIGARRVSFEP